ncbi:MAG: anti-sigma factor [Phycisphaerales bacterium]|nr:anti-sigma factor [Phycisphaerales bacterium]
MSDQHTPAPVDRMLDLLAEQAGGGLSDAQQAELDALLRESLDHGTGEFDEAAAALAESFAAEVEFESMPSHVRERCIGSARAVMSEAPIESKSSAPVPLRFTPLREPSRSGFSIGWLAAAACLALAVFGWLPRPSTTTPANPWINTTGNAPTLLQERTAFLQSHADAIVWDFAKWGDEYAGATGDVVWDPATNEGYMRFSGLPANDPNRERYQLWIVDSARGTPLEVPPIDGGLFDIGSDTGEWVVRFRARLPVEDVYGFGITVEGPEGVVISNQERKAVIAVKPEA